VGTLALDHREKGSVDVDPVASPEKRAGLGIRSTAKIRPQSRFARLKTKGSSHMQDILWTAVTIAFFTASIAYVHFCDRVK
jgi:hypothetical protein